MCNIQPILLVTRAVVFDDAGRRVLVVQRIVDDTVDSGCWELPGGKVAKGEKLQSSLVREIREETGYLIDPEKQPTLVLDRYVEIPKYKGYMMVELYLLLKSDYA
ncbi:hypothetical protein COT50_00005 [candidate division WWE3 bacterium CG08_land_8_20_14_0_20_41_10]|uniref:Nudix hydrolase domain-containing protein n=1 Tax=candidate division WWE3 bacterium CG08_land_8_20_14_0_20_41_10 TaxID=1975085 RepID=A0A2H0XD04_UNCKA|nr:MAG: hypothetical protein COT50_00005 [candidate division WWE3 bacterium CG08_land_8_20_14_0_20_41_10]